MKKILILLYVFLLLLVLMLGVGIYQNNKSAEAVQQHEIQKSFELAVKWLLKNQDLIVEKHNPILWWMLRQAVDNTNNELLLSFYQNYKRKHLDTNPPNLWTLLFFREYYRPEVPDIIQMEDLREYQIFFVYSLSCDKYLGTEPIIQAQMKPGFCSMHYLQPRCITHQLMGLRFMQRYSCGYEDTVNETITSLQDIIVDELTWDYRVGDAYIQRILMLTDSGGYDRVKPVWLHRFVSAQNPDGGWDDLHPLLPLPGGYRLGLTSMLPSIQKPTSNFHATAQAIWLLSILLQKKK